MELHIRKDILNVTLKHWELTVLYERRVAIRLFRQQAAMRRLELKMTISVVKTYNYLWTRLIAK